MTGKWQSDDLAKHVSNNREIEERIIDSDFLENTCAEQFARYSIENRIPRGQKVNLGVLLAQVGFLSAEQAAKIQSPIFEKILQNIFEGKLCDGDKSLAELLGISGAQIKFLEEIEIPDDLAAFSECMEAEDFKVHFPDVKKRIFAAVFYCNGRSNSWDHSRELKKEEIFAAAKTLSSLEKTRIEDRDRLLTEYRDYIIMRRAYQNYKDHMRDDDPLREEFLSYGDVPINIKPSKIRDCHNKLGRIIEVFHCSDQILKYSRAIEERYEKEAKQREYADGRYSILMPKDAFDIIREGRELQHCVGRAGYIGSMAAGRCTILFLRSCDNPNTPLITIEERDKMIRQCYGFLNSYNKDAEIRDFIKTYADLQGLTIGTVIYEDDIRGGV
ncbi:MAG: PcfJ domain-containing protein [Lachnospiraceae bacterium]|nr:PcfJ domain-containing protein [Lachnospiraceae bacterium]